LYHQKRKGEKQMQSNIILFQEVVNDLKSYEDSEQYLKFLLACVKEAHDKE
jgi:hypothetical protein